MAIGIEEIVSPNDASILSMIAARPGAAGGSPSAYHRFLSRLESPLAKEIASVLVGEADAETVSAQARQTADALRHWYDVKRERTRLAKQGLQSRRRRLIARTVRASRS